MSDYEKGRIDGLAHENFNDSTIACSIGRSKNAVRQYLSKRGTPRKLKRLGRPQKVSPTVLVREVMKHCYTASELHHATGVNASLPTVQMVLQADENLQWRRLKARPKLEEHHMKARFKWSRETSFVDASKWRKAVFTDEKRFCFHGPDGINSF